MLCVHPVARERQRPQACVYAYAYVYPSSSSNLLWVPVLLRGHSLAGSAHPIASRSDATATGGGLRRQQSCRTHSGNWNSEVRRCWLIEKCVSPVIRVLPHTVVRVDWCVAVIAVLEAGGGNLSSATLVPTITLALFDVKLLKTFSSAEYCLRASRTSRFVASTSYR